jgi:hypothetical protein
VDGEFSGVVLDDSRYAEPWDCCQDGKQTEGAREAYRSFPGSTRPLSSIRIGQLRSSPEVPCPFPCAASLGR